MHQILLPDQVYNDAQRRASDAGFNSVDDYIVDLLADEDLVETPDLDHLFTPERIAHIDQVLARVKAGGKTYTMAETRAAISKKRAEWIRNNQT